MKYLILILFIGTTLAEIKAPISEDDPPEKKEYLCGLAGFLNCQQAQKQCVSPLNNTEEWTEATLCTKIFSACFETAIVYCEAKYGPPKIPEE